MTLELYATPQEVMRAVETLQTLGREHGFDEQQLFAIALALEECGSNIVDHSLRRDPEKQFRVTMKFDNGVVTLELRDKGPAFDPTAAPARTRPADEDDPPGGWGIHLVRKYVDEILYRREAVENVLTLKKNLKPTTASK